MSSQRPHDPPPPSSGIVPMAVVNIGDMLIVGLLVVAGLVAIAAAVIL